MLKKNVKISILALLLLSLVVVLFFLLNPFYWGMRRRIPEQPELTLQERILITRIEKSGDWFGVHRSYANLDSLGNADWNRNTIDTNSDHLFSISSSTYNHTYSNNLEEEYNLKLAYYIKDSVLNNSKHIRQIEIIWIYRDRIDHSGNRDKTYRFRFIRDTMSNILSQSQ